MSIAVPHPSQEGCVALFTRRYFVRVYGGTSFEYTAVLRPSIRWYFVRVYGGTSSGALVDKRCHADTQPLFDIRQRSITAALKFSHC